MQNSYTEQDINDLANTIWEEFFNEGEIDRIRPLNNLIDIDFIKERIQTHSEDYIFGGHEDIDWGRFNCVTFNETANDVKKLLTLKIQVLLIDFDTKLITESLIV